MTFNINMPYTGVVEVGNEMKGLTDSLNKIRRNRAGERDRRRARDDDGNKKGNWMQRVSERWAAPEARKIGWLMLGLLVNRFTAFKLA